MYIARFSYDVLPVNRERAMDFIRKEVEAARSSGLKARLLVPFTRGLTGAALQFELELKNLDQLDQFRSRGLGSRTWRWSRANCARLPSRQLTVIEGIACSSPLKQRIFAA